MLAMIMTSANTLYLIAVSNNSFFRCRTSSLIYQCLCSLLLGSLDRFWAIAHLNNFCQSLNLQLLEELTL
jgi:hypothetical protein